MTTMTLTSNDPTDFDVSICEYWRARAVRFDTVTALHFMYKRISHARLWHAVRHMAATLAQMGVRAGDVVTVCLPNIPSAVAALYAINYLGAVAGVLHPLTPPQAILDTMRDTDSRYLLCFDKLFVVEGAPLCEADICILLLGADNYFSSVESTVIRAVNGVTNGAICRMQRGAKAHICVYQFGNKVVLVPPSYPKGKDVCLHLHSGGTTGVPKVIPVTNHMLNAAAHAIIALTQPPQVGKSAMLMVLPIFHGFGIGVCLHAMLPYGVRVVLQPAFDPARSVNLIRRHHITYLAGVPTMFDKMLSTGRMKGRGMRSLQNAYCGGDMCSPALKEQFDHAMAEAGSPCRLYQGYGLTETVSVCCAHSPYTDDRLGSIGLPVDCVQMRIVDDLGNPLPHGARGEICVSGDTVMSGYLDGTPDGVLTMDEGRMWLHTGDCGYCDADGYFHFVGRKKRMSIVAGVNVYHQEIEQLAMAVPGIDMAAITETREGGKVGVKLWLRTKLPGDVAVETVRNALKNRLTKYCVPRTIVVVDSLPLTPMGKVDYRALTALDA